MGSDPSHRRSMFCAFVPDLKCILLPTFKGGLLVWVGFLSQAQEASLSLSMSSEEWGSNLRPQGYNLPYTARSGTPNFHKQDYADLQEMFI